MDGVSCSICDQRALHRHIEALENEITAWREQWKTAANDMGRHIPGFDKKGYTAAVLASIKRECE